MTDDQYSYPILFNEKQTIAHQSVLNVVVVYNVFYIISPIGNELFEISFDNESTISFK